ncbi:MAG: 16S rRNA (guanine(966)-N(2))-methyltransferase RsmD [Myxococcaceae bacterium]|nr:16S rRNA (guanine(966)-N(2))-methyltransferase RsmD [Myxococcaceae bacterium]
MRIIAGLARGRVLKTPRGGDVTRPTADRVRETVFNVLGQSCEGLRVLDLFAGTGALGLEAVSRGASRAVLVDDGREAVAVCRQNVEALGFGDRVAVRALPVRKALAALEGEASRFELVFSDPPYAHRAGVEVLEGIAPLVVPSGVAVIEHGRDEALDEVVGPWRREDERRFGGTVVSIFRLTPRAP